MGLDIGMVGGALERDVQRDFQPGRRGRRHQVGKVFLRAEFGQDVLVPALGGADGPRAAHVVGAGRQRVVLALALLAADRMDRREVQHVEAHGGDRGEQPLDISEGTVHARRRRSRARKELVPGAEAGAVAIGHQREIDAELRLEAAIGIALGDDGQAVVERERFQLGCRHAGAQAFAFEGARPLQQRLAVFARGALGRRGNLDRAHARRQADVFGIDPALQFMPPRLEGIDPRRHGVVVAARRRRREFGMPFVVVAQLHRHFVPGCTIAFAPPAQHDAQGVVALGKAVRRDAHAFGGDPLDGKAPAIDAWQDGIDDGAGATIGCGRRAFGHRLALTKRMDSGGTATQ